jgi:hypothetical protein
MLRNRVEIQRPREPVCSRCENDRDVRGHRGSGGLELRLRRNLDNRSGWWREQRRRPCRPRVDGWNAAQKDDGAAQYPATGMNQRQTTSCQPAHRPTLRARPASHSTTERRERCDCGHHGPLVPMNLPTTSRGVPWTVGFPVSYATPPRVSLVGECDRAPGSD